MLLILSSAGLLGCAATTDSVPEDQLGEACAAAGDGATKWQIPAATLAAGDEQDGVYTPAPLWEDGANCAGDLLAGTKIIRRYLLNHFTGIDSVIGYHCEQGTYNTAKMGIHGTGRAIDVMIPQDGSWADNEVGDPIGNFLIENAEIIGIQYIIWDQVDWSIGRPDGHKAEDYDGTSNKHVNHLHVEVTAATADNAAPWFEDAVSPPVYPGCPVAAEGALIDESNPCVLLFGPGKYWRDVQGSGYESSLQWTGVTDSTSRANWASWPLSFAEAGSYRVEVYVDPAFATATAVQYEVTHDTTVSSLDPVDQSSVNGWYELGTFQFSAGEGQSVAMLDNQPNGDEGQQVVADALRLTRLDSPPPDEPGGAAGADPAVAGAGGEGGQLTAIGGASSINPVANDATSGGEAEGSCALGRAPSKLRGAPAFAALALLGALGRRRHARRAA